MRLGNLVPPRIQYRVTILINYFRPGERAYKLKNPGKTRFVSVGQISITISIHSGLMLEVVLTPAKVKAWDTRQHNPNILMGAFHHLKNTFHRLLSPGPHQEEPLLELRGLTTKDLEQRLALTKGYPVVTAIFIQSQLNGENDEKQFLSGREAKILAQLLESYQV